MIDWLKYPVPHAQVASRVVDGTAVIVLADSGEVSMLNSVGTRVWELVDGKRSVRDIANAIIAEYDVTAETAERDVASFMQLLIDAKAVTLQDQPR